MHGHEPFSALQEFANAVGFASGAFVLGMMLFFVGVLPIPVGYERGKVKWVMWCGTGMHAHIVYWTDDGFQTLHPADKGGDLSDV